MDFPAHVGLDGEPEWDLSGSAAIRRPEELFPEEGTPHLELHFDEVPHAVLFETDGEALPSAVIEAIAESETVGIVGTDAAAPGDKDAHHRLLESDIFLLENLRNLDAPRSRDGYLYCFPTLVAGCDDGAVASVAFEPR